MPSGRDNPGISGHANETPAAEGRRDSSSARRGKPDFTRRALIPLCLASLILILFVGWQLDRAGILGGSTQTHALPEGDFTEMPSEIQASLDTAMVELRTGFAANALKRLDLIEKRNPQLPSITYLSALAALQAGDPDQASQKADASIAKGERVSDCLALKAVLETQKHRVGNLGDPKIRAEMLLRQSIARDIANPFPQLELATLLRYQGRNEEALVLLKRTRGYLNPIDSHAVVDTSILLLDLENTPTGKLPTRIEPQGEASTLFASAYLEMRQGNFSRAASHLEKAKKVLPTDLYHYLVDDPALRKFSREPTLKDFF
jgi:tetratricopeptide (TPR) repeat protein